MNYKKYFKKNLFEAISREQITPEVSTSSDDNYIPHHLRDKFGPDVLTPYYSPNEFDRNRNISEYGYNRDWYRHFPDNMRTPQGWNIPPIPPNLLNKPVEEMTQDELALYYEFMRALEKLWRHISPLPVGPMPNGFWPFPPGRGVNPWIPLPYPQYYSDPNNEPPFTPPDPMGLNRDGRWLWDPYFGQWYYIFYNS